MTDIITTDATQADMFGLQPEHGPRTVEVEHDYFLSKKNGKKLHGFKISFHLAIGDYTGEWFSETNFALVPANYTPSCRDALWSLINNRGITRFKDVELDDRPPFPARLNFTNTRGGFEMKMDCTIISIRPKLTEMLAREWPVAFMKIEKCPWQSDMFVSWPTIKAYFDNKKGAA